MYCMRHIHNPDIFINLIIVISNIFRHIHVLFRHIHPYCGISRTLYSPCNSESWHIWNPRYIQNSVKVYSGVFRMLCNACILKTLPYSELCHIQKGLEAYSNPCQTFNTEDLTKLVKGYIIHLQLSILAVLKF